jgi:hypothetical protein
MELIQQAELSRIQEHMYLPHHAVLKPSSSTTKLRVVFNGAAVSSNGISLSDKLLVGPKTQRNLVDILLSFRKFKIAMVADIEKMYRQVLIHEKDRSLQRIIWRSSSSEPFNHFNLKTVTYGTTSAPFLATRALKELTNEFKNQYPLAESALLNNFYVDDFLGGANSEDEAVQLYNELMTLLSRRGFFIRRWNSSSTSFIENIRSSAEADKFLLIDENSENLRVLGLKWCPGENYFTFNVSLPVNSVPSKRNILSESSKVYDPLGLITPVTVLFKILMQKLWLKNCQWDKVDEEIAIKWNKLRENLSYLNLVKVSRYIYGNAENIQLHGFCDSSELAYAAVVYCRAVASDGEVITTLVSAKSKVCPIKQLSIPRLELCSAVLLAKMFKFLTNCLEIPIEKCVAWTDSTVVLSWLSAPPRKWKSFVANRTSFILSTLSRSQWHHVTSSLNPADIASRGSTPQQLINSTLWWNGPSFLKFDWTTVTQNCPPDIKDQHQDNINNEAREKYIEILQATLESNDSLLNLFNDHSKLYKIIHILRVCFKFIRHCRTTASIARNYIVNAEDTKKAYNSLIKWTQELAFPEELKLLRSNKQLKSSSSIISLFPFLDEEGILRVGGRIANSNISFNSKHQVILPKHGIFVKYLIVQFHEKYLHANINLLLNVIRQQFWILSCRRLVKSIINKCMICVRHRGQLSQQLMANLPRRRVEVSRAFLNIGVDYAGPLELIYKRCKGPRITYKAYIVLFICFSTRAIHLELAGDLTAETYIAAFKRFISRRGLPRTIFSDNGTNFVKANSMLQELKEKIHIIHNDPVIHRFVADNSISWEFNPPSAPHFGGLWEAGVKSVKGILYKVVNKSFFTYEEMNTLLVQIEGLLNSRPLAPVSDDISSIECLTPAHFLVGHPITMLPESSECNLSLQQRWRHIQHVTQNFWTRWRKEYLCLLQQRPKWQSIEENIHVDDLVTIKEKLALPGQWTTGRVIKIYPNSKDKLVRMASVRTEHGILERPIVKSCKLPF